MSSQIISSSNSRASTPRTQRENVVSRSHGIDAATKVQPIAIVGLACKLPGGATSASKFWDLLARGESGQCDVPGSRFNVDAFYHPQGVDRPGSMNTKGGYFLKDDILAFENSFFGINNLEATSMDPQQRKLLEVVFECFESAGLPLDKVSGSNTGCYVGNFTIDYQVMQTRDPEYLSRYSATGMGTTILGNRISHAFNLLGPSLVLDTACSSSLYCLHTACTALENGECDGAVVAGANLIQSPEQHLGTMKAGVLSQTSTCHTFDSSADGYGRADGIGALYLKRLDDAIRDGDAIRSVIRATATNANGKTSGITLPSADGQEAVIRKAYAKACIGFSETAYVECHGTGTKVGDVIEVEALSRIFRHPADAPLLIGSVKTNVGHSEAASGISSVIKTTLALEKSLIPATVGLRDISPKLKTVEWRIDIPTTLTSWPDKASGLDSVRRASINSFGYGGANAHAILENAHAHVKFDYDEASKIDHALGLQGSVLLPFSAATPQSLDARVHDLLDFDFHDASIHDLAYTLGSRRTHFAKRGYMLLPRNVSIRTGLPAHELRTIPNTASHSASHYAFIFTGQGSQWPEMCQELFDFPAFREAISEMDVVLQSLPHPPAWTLREALLEESSTSMIHHPTRSQPACTAIQVALVQLLASWDISPSAALGHSSGEIAAAFATGYLSSAAAITIAYYRGYVVGKHISQGAMIAAGLSEKDATAEIALAGLQDMIQVACINSPESVTISGDESGVDKLLGMLQDRKIFARKLKTGGQAYHSHHMRVLGEEYQGLLERALPHLDVSSKLSKGAIFISSVTAEQNFSSVGPAYWRSNLESQVRFADAVVRLNDNGDFHLIEVGPHSALELPIKQIRSGLGITEDRMRYSTAIKRHANSLESILSLAGSLWLHGHDISFDKVNCLRSRRKCGIEGQNYKVLYDLPPYRWHYDGVLWDECRASVEFRQRKYPRHELLGSQIPGGNGIDIIWRNVLRVDDILWLRDHKLEETVVLPGACYLSIAMEAVLQVSRPVERPTFRLENVNILTPFTFSAESSAKSELFTVMRRAPITKTSNSDIWWDFNIDSFSDGTSVHHASGSISIPPHFTPMLSKYQAPADCLESSSPRMWYEKLAKQGLNFGPCFQSIQEFQVPRMKSVSYCTTKVPLLQTCGDDLASYAIHPITLDAMLQTAIVATTAGNSNDLHAKVPTRIGVAVIETPETSLCPPSSINSRAESVGFGTAEIGAELVNFHGRVSVQLENVRLAPYEVTSQVGVTEERHPILRVLWKPDVHGLGLISADRLSDYLDEFASEAHSNIADEGLLKLGGCLSLLAHKSPGLRILEMGNEISEITEAFLEFLSANTAFRRLQSYTVGSLSESGELFGASVNFGDGERQEISLITGQTFDLVLLPHIVLANFYLENRIALIMNLIGSEGLLVALSDSNAKFCSNTPELEVVQCDLSSHTTQIVLARKVLTYEAHKESLNGHNLVIIDRGLNRLSEAVMRNILEATGRPVMRLAMNEVTENSIVPGATVISFIECHKPVLSTATDDEMYRIKLITNNASNIIWVTGGNLLEGTRPDFALVSGLARALMLEQPSLKFFTFDVDDIVSHVQQTAEHLVSILTQKSNSIDFEFIQRQTVVHVSRFVPDGSLNESFMQKQGKEIIKMPLQEAKLVQLMIERVGQFDSLFFRQVKLQGPLQADGVQVQVTSVGLNAKDFYMLAGKVDTKKSTCSLEFCGIVERTGSAVSSLAPGDRVVVMAPTDFQTSQVVPEWACQKLEDHEDFNVLCTLPVVYATALYALQDRARVQSGETILIHSGAGGVGIAAIQIAKLVGVEVFTTVSTEAKKEFLVEKFGIDPANIFSSRDASFLPGILQATNGKGVDIVLNSLTGDLLHASWRCCGMFGRFVEIGKRDLVGAGRLEMDQFLKNVTFTAFDLSYLYHTENYAYQAIWSRLLAEVLRLYRERKIMKIEPLEVFDISDISQAFRHFSSRNRTGKVAINMEDQKSVLRVQPFKYNSRFSCEKSYIMVGCLGGLGRSLSKWMMSRGARKFVFLGRSGLDKEPARRLIKDLDRNGADCKVVRGNVCSIEDVNTVMNEVNGLVGGVIQAAMSLNEALFTTMSNQYWHTSIDPKVIGTWNLHNAIKGKDSEIEFFLMTSSVSGSVGTATESNYCSANYFLDVFARYRRGLGLPATSIGLGMISEVGYLHENPEIEALLLRKGIQAMNEDELLQVVDIALSSDAIIPHAYDHSAHAHILTGLEPFGLKELRKKGFEGTNLTLHDPRAAILARALDGQLNLAYKDQDGNLPVEVVDALEKGVRLADAVLMHVVKRFANLVLLLLEQVDVSKPLADYGMDSMIAAEFRTWFFQTFHVDIPYLTLLNKSTTLLSLSEAVTADVETLGKK